MNSIAFVDGDLAFVEDVVAAGGLTDGDIGEAAAMIVADATFDSVGDPSLCALLLGKSEKNAFVGGEPKRWFVGVSVLGV